MFFLFFFIGSSNHVILLLSEKNEITKIPPQPTYSRVQFFHQTCLHHNQPTNRYCSLIKLVYLCVFCPGTLVCCTSFESVGVCFLVMRMDKQSCLYGKICSEYKIFGDHGTVVELFFSSIPSVFSLYYWFLASSFQFPVSRFPFFFFFFFLVIGSFCFNFSFWIRSCFTFLLLCLIVLPFFFIILIRLCSFFFTRDP